MVRCTRAVAMLLAVTTGGVLRAGEEVAPLAGPRRTIREVIERPGSDERITTAGTVIYSTEFGFCAINDGTGTIWTHAPGCLAGPSPPLSEIPPTPRAGDRVEVSGLRLPVYIPPRLTEVVWRVLGTGPLPEPPLVKEADLLVPAAAGRRYRLRAQILDIETSLLGTKHVTTVWIKAGSNVFQCIHAGREYGKFKVKAGDYAEVVGLTQSAARSNCRSLNSNRSSVPTGDCYGTSWATLCRTLSSIQPPDTQ